MPTGSNIYARNREAAFERFGARLQGSHAGLVLVAFTQPVSPEGRDALRKSFAALEYGRDACTYADVSGLNEQEAFALIEGMDPVCLIAADADAAAICARAAHQDFPLKQPLRLFGREARGFADLNGMLDSQNDRQLLWHLLKSLG